MILNSESKEVFGCLLHKKRFAIYWFHERLTDKNTGVNY